METVSNKKKAEQLGMPLGTASGKLKKIYLFSLLQRLGEDVCFRCHKKIERVDDLSIEHKIPWLDSDNPKTLFFDLSNISVSHLKCNIGDARQTKERSHPSSNSYKNGCHCKDCRSIEKIRRKDQRARGIPCR